MEQDDEKDDPNSLYTTILHKMIKYGRKAGRLFCKWYCKEKMKTPDIHYNYGGKQLSDRACQTIPAPSLTDQFCALVGRLVNSWWFTWTVIVVIILNTIALAAEHYNQVLNVYSLFDFIVHLV